MVTATGPGFTHAVETCRVKGLYTAVADVTKSYMNSDNSRFFGRVKKRKPGAASTNTDKIRTNKSHSRKSI